MFSYIATSLLFGYMADVWPHGYIADYMADVWLYSYIATSLLFGHMADV